MRDRLQQPSAEGQRNAERPRATGKRRSAGRHAARAERRQAEAGAEAGEAERPALIGTPSLRTRPTRKVRLAVVFATILVAISGRAEPDGAASARASEARAEPFAVSSSALSDDGRLVVAPRDDALSLSVCMAPVGPPRDGDAVLAVAGRGGDASHVVLDGVGVFCASLPAAELPFALWLSARVLGAERGTRGSSDRTDAAAAPQDAAEPGVARARAIALEGALDDDERHPARFVVTLTGRVDEGEAERLAALRFDVHEGSTPAPRANPWHPQQTTERMSAMEADVASPRARYAWITPQGSEDEAGVRLALEVLGGGDEARLPRLFRGTHLGKRAEAWELHSPGGTLSGLVVEPSARVSIDRLRRFVDGALKQLRLVGPSRRELSRARQRLLLDAYRTWGDPVALGRLLSSYELVRGGAERARSAVAAVQRITARDVSRAVQRTLIDARRTTVELYPPAFPPDDPRIAGQKLYTVLPGDTLSSVADRFHVAIAAIARANDLDPKYAITEGQPLWIPVTTRSP